MSAIAKLTNGEAISVAGATQAKLTPVVTPEISEEGYYMLGDFQEQSSGKKWDEKNPVVMER